MTGEWLVLTCLVGVLALAVGLRLGRRAARGGTWPPAASGARDAGDGRDRPEGRDGTGAGGDGAGVGGGELLDLLRAGAVVAEPSGVVVRANPAAADLGLVREDRLVHAELERLVRDAAHDHALREADVEVLRSPFGATPALLRVRAAPLATGRVLLVAEDRTATRRAEEIRRDFVVNVSHELKTPVGALSLLAETVEDAADDPGAVRRFAAAMQREAHRLSTLVQDVIELSRLQDTGAVGAAAQVAVPDVVREAVDRARVTAEGRDISIDVGPVPDVSVMGDRDMLVTAVRNLLDNAIGYSEPGTRVAVGTTSRPRRGVVEIAVVDQGIGIPPEALPRLFERFYRVDPARSRDTGGTGLGLSIVKHVAADHGGEVTVWSQPGQGSTFTLRLPVAPDARLSSAPDDGDARHGRYTARRRPLPTAPVTPVVPTAPAGRTAPDAPPDTPEGAAR